MNILNNREAIRKNDKFNMLDKLRKTPLFYQLLKEPEVDNAEYLRITKYHSIIICGVGGSAIVEDIISDWLRDTISIPIFVNRGYSLPAFVNENSYAVTISYSGNTFETILQFRNALRRECTISAITSNGKILKKMHRISYSLHQSTYGFAT